MWVKTEPQGAKRLEHLSSCDSDMQSDFCLAVQEGAWGNQGGYYLQDPATDLGFQQFSSYECYPQPSLETRPFLGEVARGRQPYEEPSPGYKLLAEGLCPVEEGLEMGLGVEGDPCRGLEDCDMERGGVDFEEAHCCGGTPCSQIAETFNMGVSGSAVDTTMDGIIEGLMLEHSPYSPRKRLPYLLPPTSFDPTAALPAIPQLSTELPPALELGPLERFRPLPPLAEPPQVDNLGEVFEKLPQLKCGAETGPGAAEQGSVGSRPKRHRRVKTQPSPLASAGSRVSKKRRPPSPQEDEEEGDQVCLEKKQMMVTASGRRVSQLLLAERGRQWAEPPTPKNKNRCKNHKPWTIEETTALVWGVEKMGGGKWAEIKKLDCPQTECLQRRTAVDLKDKWRNLQNAIERVACDKKKGDLSRDLVERICRMRGSCNTKARGDSHKSNGGKHACKRMSLASRGSTPCRGDSDEWLPGH